MLDDWPREQRGWRQVAEQAAEGLKSLRVEGNGFRGVDSDQHAATVASARCVEALVELTDIAREWARPFDYVDAAVEDVLAISPADALADLHDEATLAEAAEVQDTNEPTPHRETLPEPLLEARFLPCAVSALVTSRARAGLRRAGEAAQEGVPVEADPSLPQLVGELVRQSVLVDAIADSSVHPFVIYRVAKALWLAELATDTSPVFGEAVGMKEALKTKALHITERLVAEHALRDVSDSQSVALAFCAATLAIPPADDLRYIDTALEAALASQSPNGSWADGRAVTWHSDPDTGQPLVVSTHDVALAVAETMSMLGIPRATRGRPMQRVVDGLMRALSHAQSSSLRSELPAPGGTFGWAASHQYGHTQVRAAPTAAVLQLAATIRRVAELQRQTDALGRFADVWDPVSDFTAPFLEWDKYRESGEPDAANPILPYLDNRFVDQAKRRRREDPRPWKRTAAMSVILFGPPGTTKTTIVKSMAEGLKWPLVTLSPGTFVEEGLDSVERRTSELFLWLRDLAETVVLFDECDELFRARNQGARDIRPGGGGPSPGGDQARSITAFLTASMLPKLQDLRDRGQVFFVIATNYFDQIDSAVRRVGRIDSIVGVGWPDEAQRDRTIRKEFGDALTRRRGTLDHDIVDHAVKALASSTRYFVRGDLVGAASAMAERHTEMDTPEAAKRVADEVRQQREKSITDHDLKAFKDDAPDSSVPHLKNRGELAG